MTVTQEAPGTPPVSRTVFVEALHHVARLVELHGVPAPFAIVGDVGGEVVVHVRPDDLVWWVLALDIPAPDWQALEIEDGARIHLRATWPDDVMFELLFRIQCDHTVPTVFEPVPAGGA